MTQKQLPITGYLSRLSVRPGESLEAKISVRTACACRVRLARVISADANPNGPGLRYEDLSERFERGFEGRNQPIVSGSWAQIPGPVLEPKTAYCWTALVAPSLERVEKRVVLYHSGPSEKLTISVGSTGVEMVLESRGTRHVLGAIGALRTRRWHRVWASLDPKSGRIAVGFVSPAYLYDTAQDGVAIAVVPELIVPSGGTLLLATAQPGNASVHFNGKIEDPAVLRGFRERWAEPLEDFERFGATLEAGWNFSIGIDTQMLSPCGPKAAAGTLFNMPMRAVVGARWRGREHCWRHAPQDYGAIEFHEDDLSDCGWATDFSFMVPADLPSGSYVLHLTCPEGEDWLPFYVLGRRGSPDAAIVFLAPTFTYQAYANHARGNCDDAFRERVSAWGAYPFNPDDYPVYGRSTYNRHPDGSGVAFSSRLRPMLTMRPGFMTFCEVGGGSGLRHYPADSHLLAWLESRGFEFDVVTDEDLHEEGVSLLAPYKVVLTGSHPEYHTARTLDALRDYTHSGGRLAYLGGNGFYWRIARDETLPGTIELRRAEGGTRAWAAEPGEYYHMTDGEYGGLWRRNARDPQQLVGIGFSAQGLFEATHYRRTPESYDSAHAWVFEGVEGDVLGDYGLNAGGAAGFEFDRADTALGTPLGATVLARSENPPASFFPVMEELLIPSVSVTGQPPTSLVRADMVLFDVPGGGAVFSVGSITFCGSLWRNGFEGPVSRLLENVIKRFCGALP